MREGEPQARHVPKLIEQRPRNLFRNGGDAHQLSHFDVVFVSGALARLPADLWYLQAAHSTYRSFRRSMLHFVNQRDQYLKRLVGIPGPQDIDIAMLI